MFALGEVICRFCMDTEYIEAAVIGSVILPVLLYFLCKTVLQGRAVFLLVVGSFLLGVLWGWIIFQVKRPLDAGTHLSGSFVISRLSEGEDGCSMELICGNDRYYAYVSYEKAAEWLDESDQKAERYKGLLRVGQGYRFTGEVKELAGPTNPGQFDHKQYLYGRGIRRQLDIQSMERCSEYDSWLRIMLDKCRESLVGVIGGLMPERYSGVLSAMLFGEKSALDEDMRKLYQVNGIAHILAISSLHMAFFAAIISGFLRMIGVSRKFRAVLTITGLFLYGLMTGFSDATIRAFIMITAVLLAEVFGRTPDKPTAMITALLVMLLINPDCILSSSFQMSYAAAGGLIFSEMIYKAIYENERFKGVNRRIRKRYKLFVMGLISSVSLNVCMVPLIAGGYFEVPLYSMAVNFIIIPLLFFAVAFGFAAAVTGLAGLCLPVVGDFVVIISRGLAFPSEMILRFYEWLCRFFMRLPMARINCGGVRVWEYIVYGILLAGIVLYFGRGNIIRKRKNKHRNAIQGIVNGIVNKLKTAVVGKIRRSKGKENEKDNVFDPVNVCKRRLSGRKSIVSYEMVRKREIKRCIGYILSCVLLETALIVGTILINRSGSYAVMLDVGQGNASFVHTREGLNMIYDCGSTSKNDVGRNILVPALKFYSMSEIDMVFLSHSDADHINGLIYLFENSFMEGVTVDKLCLAEGIQEDENLERLIFAAEKAGCEVVYVSAGDVVRAEKARIEVVYPYAEDASGGDISGDDTSDGGISSGGISDSYASDGDISNEDISGSDASGGKFSKGDFSYGDSHDRNDQSLVIRLLCDESSILFTGDIGSDIERLLVDKSEGRSVDSDVLVCPHHGSKYSSSERFIEAVSPETVVISCGKNNLYGHPAEETLERYNEAGVRIRRTDKEGAIIIGIE